MTTYVLLLSKSRMRGIQNIVNTSTLITKTPTHYKNQTYKNPNITKQVTTNTVQVKTNIAQEQTYL